MQCFSIILFFLVIQVVKVHPQRTKDKMYSSIIGASCFRRLNGTHQTGCSSTFSGSTGVLHVIKTEKDFDFIINDPPSPPYAPVIPPNLFTRKNILRLKNEAAQYVSVIIVIHEHMRINNFSQELKCPNQYSGLKDQQTCDPDKPETTWNPYGTGLLHENFPFPIYYVPDSEEIEKIVNCFEKFNSFDLASHNSRSLCSIQVKSFMSAAVNSEVCIRRSNFVNNLSPTRYCDPLKGKNVYATLFPREIIEPGHRAIDRNEKFILISSRIDTTSMFDGVGLGAMDSLVSFASLVHIGHMLSELLPQKVTRDTYNILFMVFNGETYDYIGSQRFVYDLKNIAFPSKSTSTNPITLQNIEFMIDIGVLDDLNNVKLHYVKGLSRAEDFLNLLKEYDAKFDFGIGFSSDTSRFPPTAAQSFLRENMTFPAIVLNTEPTNRFYHSIYDNADNINFNYQNTSSDFIKLKKIGDKEEFFENDSIQMKIRNISSLLASAVYTLITGINITKEDAQVVNPVLADEFLFCFLLSADCPLFRASSHPHSLPALAVPPLRYVSVHGSLSHEATGWTHRILGYLVGQKNSIIEQDKCSQLPLYWFAGQDGKGECHITTQNYSDAYSPAFLQEDYDWKSGKYSTWTESTWRELSARIFLRPSKSHEAVTLAIGFIVMIISFIIVFLTNSRSDVLFGNAVLDVTTTEPAAC